VSFARLALAIIDEQHRFGVHQRLALTDKGTRRRPAPAPAGHDRDADSAHPRDGDLCRSRHLDHRRAAARARPGAHRGDAGARRAEVVARIREACAAGRQAYWVCPLIEESDQLQAQAAEDTATLLAEALPELSIGLIHGRLRPAEKDRIMRAFKAGEIHLLVATTVIEVGVDVPRASLMIIENAERMGLAQLHQLRGRVGRGEDDATCLLLYRPPLSPAATTRLAALRDSNDGFEIARTDLQLRGPGEVLGIRQTGLLALKVADLVRDQHLMPLVRALADRLLQSSIPRRSPR
jgi:ATP-dependent DNA helicase RecG